MGLPLVVVVNTQTGEEALIPRACVGEISIIDHPVVIVGLRRELEWREGAVYPHRRPVIEFPLAVNDGPTPAPHPGRRAPVVNIRLEPGAGKRRKVKVATAIMLGAIGCLILADLAREQQVWQRGHIAAGESYTSIVSRFGLPAAEKTRGECRLLFYPRRRLVVALSKGNRYLGAFDSAGKIVDAVTQPDGTDSRTLLRSLPPF